MATTITKLLNFTPLDELLMIYNHQLDIDIKRYQLNPVKLLGNTPLEMAISTPTRKLIREILIYKMSGEAINHYVEVYGGLGKHEYHENQYPFPKHKKYSLQIKAKILGLQDYFATESNLTNYEVEVLEDYQDNSESDEEAKRYAEIDFLNERLEALQMKKVKTKEDLIQIRFLYSRLNRN